MTAIRTHALLENVDSELGGRAAPPRLLAMESTGRRSPHPVEFTSASNRQSRGETMALSKRVRFDIFKRDAFTCQYCGRKTPDVVLEVDHIVPRAEGGGDEIENLTTACFDCNRGKAAELLDTPAALIDLAHRTSIIREREEQIRAYNEAKALEQERIDQAFNDAWDYWFDISGAATSLPHWLVPKESFLRHYVTRLPVEEVKEAMRLAIERHGGYARVAPYFGGICRRKIADMEGRTAICCGCGRTVVLDPGHDPTHEWWHTDCLEKEGNDG